MTAARNTRASRSNSAALAGGAAKEVIAAAAKAVVGIFTRHGAKVEAILFITKSTNKLAPAFGGYLAGEKVSAFLRHPEGRKPFLSLVNAKGDQVATANFRVRYDGIPVVKAILADKSEAWFNVSKKVTDDMLATLGTDMSKLHVKTAKVSKEAATA